MGLGCGSKTGGAPKITMRTLEDPKTSLWTLKYQVSFAEIWASDSYKGGGAAREGARGCARPPQEPRRRLLLLAGVHLRTRKVVECAAHELDVPASEGGVSSSSVLAWELPPTLTAGSTTLQFSVFR
ncbi:hypothetical protein QOZ80_5AG0369430 [Eleusine coracana subsp. coracana]|nr:hypothetical protein QOZ80_5AG0369430 [Eleusine coracana subsp. coracana]